MNNENYCVLREDNLVEEKPYEKCLALGAKALTDAQLLAVILRTGTNGLNATSLAYNVFAASGSFSEKDGNQLLNLMNLSIPELMKIKGIGKVKAIQIQCICELSRRIAKQTAGKKLNFGRPQTIAEYYMEDMRHLEKEYLILALLDGKCCLIRDLVVTIGTVNSSLVNTREIFAEALKYNAVSIVLLHNHPSGDSTPSRNDLAVTERIARAGEIMGINLIDHIIIGDNNYTSLKEKEFI